MFTLWSTCDPPINIDEKYESPNYSNGCILYIMSNLQTDWQYKLDIQNVDQHSVGKWSIHGTKRRKDNQLQILELPCRISL